MRMPVSSAPGFKVDGGGGLEVRGVGVVEGDEIEFGFGVGVAGGGEAFDHKGGAGADPEIVAAGGEAGEAKLALVGSGHAVDGPDSAAAQERVFEGFEGHLDAFDGFTVFVEDAAADDGLGEEEHFQGGGGGGGGDGDGGGAGATGKGAVVLEEEAGFAGAEVVAAGGEGVEAEAAIGAGGGLAFRGAGLKGVAGAAFEGQREGGAGDGFARQGVEDAAFEGSGFRGLLGGNGRGEEEEQPEQAHSS
jgi:hypothetical protein